MTLDKLAMMVQANSRDIASLARITANGFIDVDRQFVEVRKDLSGIHDELDGIKGRLHTIDNRLDNVATHDRRIERIEKKVGITVD